VPELAGDASLFDVLPCVAEAAVGGAPVRQVLSPGGPARETGSGGWLFVAGRSWPVGPGDGGGSRAGPRLLVEGGEARWTGVELGRPADVLVSWRGRFVFTAPDGAADATYAAAPSAAGPAFGLRVAQSGALHAVLAYWSTRPARPATVVLPTGSGKTETMLALLVAARLPRLLVLVPSDALREQLAVRFETPGLLHALGVVAADTDRPVVGRLRGALADPDAATAFAGACNVVVATTQALMACAPEVRDALTGACSHLFVDEAHHVAATTWAAVRDAFDPGACVQFTATPFREDGRHLGGHLVYSFPLREAQRLGYFTKIRYLSVFDLTDPDRAVAERAVAALREDFDAGRDHLLMARAASRSRAEALLPTYAALAPDLAPVVLHSGMSGRRRNSALAALRSGDSKIVLCVDMLGEGFDLPELKIAAMHDEHRSLGVTLQFVGRFTRSGANVGPATFVSAREKPHHDPRLERLYAQDRDWDLVIEELASGAVGTQQDISDFEQAFTVLPEQVSIRSVTPKMSTVVYRTRCADWEPDGVAALFGEDALLTVPPAVNQRDHVIWFVAEDRVPVRWTDLHAVEEISYALYVAYWDEARGLLFVNCSANDGTYHDLAQALCGPDVALVAGPAVYRAMHGLERLVATTVGVTDVYSRTRRFSFHVGADVADGFPTAEATTKTQTNIYAAGFDAGTRVGIGASLKGRIWSHQVAPTVKHWVDWCNTVGGKVVDPSIDPTQVVDQFIRPEGRVPWRTDRRGTASASMGTTSRTSENVRVIRV
jgi:superfamily II DNA or RNA helicase